MKKKKSFTVMLRYPDYLCSGAQPSDDVYLGCVQCTDAVKAVELARNRVMKVVNGGEVDVVDDAADFAVLAVFSGCHVDINPEA